jgi:hypothetical protein
MAPDDNEHQTDGPLTAADQELLDRTPYGCECGERFASYTLYLEHERDHERAPYRVVYLVEVLSERPFDPGRDHPGLRELAAAAQEQAATVIIREQVHELTFKLITDAPWHPAAIERIASEFNQRYGGNLAVESAYLAEARLVDSPTDPE